MYNWDDFKKDVGELFKSKERKQKEKEKYDNFKKQEVKLMDNLEKIDKDWNDNHKIVFTNYDKLIDKDINLKKKDYDNSTYNDLMDRAKNKHDSKYYDDMDRIMKNYDAKSNQEKSKLDKVNDDVEDDLVNLSQKYHDMARNASNKNHKNGLLKSSINELEISKIVSDRDDAKDDVLEDAKRKKKDIEDKMNALTDEKAKALSSLDIKRADAINKEYERLKEELQKKNLAVTKFNNDIDKQKALYKMNRQKVINELEKSERDELAKHRSREYYQGYHGDKLKNYERRRKMAYDLYSQMPKEIAVKAIKENSRLKMLLGKLYDELLSSQAGR